MNDNEGNDAGQNIKKKYINDIYLYNKMTKLKLGKSKAIYKLSYSLYLFALVPSKIH